MTCGSATTRTTWPILLLVTVAHHASARTWESVVTPDHLTHRDRFKYNKKFVLELDAFTSTFTNNPTHRPSTISPVPTKTPTNAPTHRPTTRAPTESPTFYPTSTPTSVPTSSPTEDIWAWSVPTPKDPDRGYFNYDPDSKYGPSKWDNVDDSQEAKYWEDYKSYVDPSLGNNKCDSDSGRQSPIDVNLDDAQGICFQNHEFRHRPGSYDLVDKKVKKRIYPSKLRLEYPSDVGEHGLGEFENPAADVPKGWGNQLPVTNVDFKIPSEHWFEGKQYAAEMQIWIIQNRDNAEAKSGAPVVSIMLDIDDEPNEQLQRALDAFQEVWDADMADCEDHRRRQRRLDAVAYRKIRQSVFGETGSDLEEHTGLSTWEDEPEEEEFKFQQLRGQMKERKLQKNRWNPWHPDLYRSVHFYGYEGSLTEPPCTEFVEWHIIDKPAKMSLAQLHQMKNLLFNHVDGKCRKTSVHHHGSVARPLQKMRGRDLYRCTCKNFLSDLQRVVEQRTNCRKNNEIGGDKKYYKKQEGDRDDKPWTQPYEYYVADDDS